MSFERYFSVLSVLEREAETDTWSHCGSVFGFIIPATVSSGRATEALLDPNVTHHLIFATRKKGRELIKAGRRVKTNEGAEYEVMTVRDFQPLQREHAIAYLAEVAPEV